MVIAAHTSTSYFCPVTSTSGGLFASRSRAPLCIKSVIGEFMIDRLECTNLSTFVNAKRSMFTGSTFVGGKGRYQFRDWLF